MAAIAETRVHNQLTANSPKVWDDIANEALNCSETRLQIFCKYLKDIMVLGYVTGKRERPLSDTVPYGEDSRRHRLDNLGLER